MKPTLRNLFAPILTRFEQGNDEFKYDKTHRAITIAVGILFSIICTGSIYLLILTKTPAAIFPIIAFGGVSIVALVVGCLGSDRAIAKVWNSR